MIQGKLTYSYKEVKRQNQSWKLSQTRKRTQFTLRLLELVWRHVVNWFLNATATGLAGYIDGSRAVDCISPNCSFPQVSKWDSLTKKYPLKMFAIICGHGKDFFAPCCSMTHAIGCIKGRSYKPLVTVWGSCSHKVRLQSRGSKGGNTRNREDGQIKK